MCVKMTESGRPATNEGIQQYYHTKIDELQVCAFLCSKQRTRAFSVPQCYAACSSALCSGEDTECEETRSSEKRTER